MQAETVRGTLRTGAVLAMAGGLGYGATLLLHGDLPDETTAIALEHIAGRPEWRTLKLALVVSGLLWIGGFIALVHSFPAGLGRLLGRWAISAAVIGVAIMVVEYSIIGFALKDVADTWTAAPSSAAGQEALLKADVMLAISGGLFHSLVGWMLGLPYMLLGTALLLGQAIRGGSGGWQWWRALERCSPASPGFSVWRWSRTPCSMVASSCR